MSRRIVRGVTVAVLLAAWMLMTSRALAGDRVHAGSQPAARPQPAPAPVVRRPALPVTITLTAPTPAQSATEAAYINLRGPDGRLRRFAVEGGASEMQSRVVVLRPGESLTIQWAVRK
jgi:hypothetical protein